MDTMDYTKIVGGLCGALLVLLLVNWAGEGIYHVGGSGGHEADDGHGGSQHAYVIEVQESGDGGEAEEGPAFADLFAAADAAKGEKVFGKCKACHKIEPGANGTGPTLHAIVGRAVGGEAGFGFSSAMADHGGTWTPEELDLFLTNPKAAVPGTKMTFAGLSKGEDRANLIAYLQTLQ